VFFFFFLSAFDAESFFLCVDCRLIFFILTLSPHHRALLGPTIAHASPPPWFPPSPPPPTMPSASEKHSLGIFPPHHFSFFSPHPFFAELDGGFLDGRCPLSGFHVLPPSWPAASFVTPIVQTFAARHLICTRLHPPINLQIVTRCSSTHAHVQPLLSDLFLQGGATFPPFQCPAVKVF